jgi:hypothetical protein
MYRIEGFKTRDPARRWALPDRVFFACGACHILAHAFLERYGAEPYEAVWLKPAAGFTGNHIVIDGGAWIFDYHGYSRREAFLRIHSVRRSDGGRGWTASLSNCRSMF